MKDHFDYVETLSDGTELDVTRARIVTEYGIRMAADPRLKFSQVQHYCMLARSAPNHPVDMTVFNGDYLVWSARIRYRKGDA